MDLQTVSIKIEGKVQGVFFRKFTCDAAKENGIKGFVRNEPDGSVYVEATGSADEIKKFIEWCHKGSPYSSVGQVTVSELPLKSFNNFNIRY